MNLAVQHPDKVNALIVVDIVPKAYPIHHDHILEGLEAVPVGSLTSRADADRVLANYVKEPVVRQFLLKNLSRNPSAGFSWKVNLSAINRHIEDISLGMVYSGTFDGPTLFVMGKRSGYFAPGDEVQIASVFPRAEIAWLDTAHWVQAERPQEFVDLVRKFMVDLHA